MGAKLWYRSCPAVSQISNFTVVSSRHTVWVRKAATKKTEVLKPEVYLYLYIHTKLCSEMQMISVIQAYY